MINLQIRAETGEIVARVKPGLKWTEALQGLDEVEFPCLSGLLPYANTIFNRRQVERLRREVSQPFVREIIGDEAASEIDRLCVLVTSEPHQYLWFIGD